ncbi:MAG: DUF2164 domain-containing protein [Hyphomicrobiales bacterium]|nr:MAG: DUF2164 domain-containing protein [Hyphomicrobiales bacterium]
MSEITLPKTARDALTEKIIGYFDAELGQEIGHFDAAFLLDFFMKEIGPVFYNQALLDAQAVLSKRLDSITEAISELEKPLDDALR